MYFLQLLLAVLCIGNISIIENPEDEDVSSVDTESQGKQTSTHSTAQPFSTILLYTQIYNQR